MDQVEAAGIIGGGVISENPRAQDWERRIAERSEQLYRARLVRRFLLIWVYPVNVLLAVLAISGFVLYGPSSVTAAAAVVVLASIAVSARLGYVQHFKVRAMEFDLRALEQGHREHLLEEFGSGDLLGVRKHYRAHLPDVIDRYRAEARRHRRRDGLLQSVVVAGSIVAACVTAISMSIVDARWGAVLLSLAVALSAAFAGHARFAERGVLLQRTADSLEREYESVELRVGRYRRLSGEDEAYAEFADTVESLRADQARQLGPMPRADALGQ
ncbi:DUF4231 domain-containing protein [Saccharopolyspora taberi]|uniref:DUF4231 domain-containing protein n=1 Tax=Saccharopolyspora taberi TaxID=60895 RepID=A0ABN3VCB6_9PSEU